MHFKKLYRGLKTLLSSISVTVLKWWQITTPQILRVSSEIIFYYILLIKEQEGAPLSWTNHFQVSHQTIKIHCMCLFSTLFILTFVVSHIGANEAVIPAVISKLITKKTWGANWFWSNSKQWKIQYVANCWPWRQICRARIVGYVLQVSFYSPQQYVRYDWLLKCLPGNCCSHLGPNTVILKMPEWCDAWLPRVSSKSGLSV